MVKPQTILAGYGVAVCLAPDTAPDSCYVGLVEAVDEMGILINLVHWDDQLDMLGGYTESIFLPWRNINSILVSTDKQPTRRFMVDRAPKWRHQVEVMCGKKKATKPGA